MVNNMKDKIFEIKAMFILFFTSLTASLGIFAVPIYILVFLNVIDYTTGLIAAPYRDEKINSYKGFRGIAKKVCMWLLIVVGVILDWLLIYAGTNIGIDIGITCLASSTVSVWLIANELISLLENMADIGVKMPNFLMKIVEKIKSASDVDVK